MYNKVIMMGRIVNDLELQTTPSGVSVCKFRIAVDRKFQAKGEEKKSDFFNVVAWRSSAEFVCNYFAKGRMILVEGELQTRPYTDKNGNQATWYEIVADRICFTGEKKDGGGQSYNPNAVPAAPQPTPEEIAPQPTPEEIAAIANDNDYPF